MDGTRLAVVAAGWLAGWWLLLRLRALPVIETARYGRVSRSQRALSITVVVPARNEARSLTALLASLAGQAPDVIVVDDSSEDATADVAAGAGARVIPAPPPPRGWTGKSWACHLGAEQSSGDRLLFLDADTVLGRDAVARLLAAHDTGLLSVEPWHRCGRAVESLSALFNLVSLMGIGAFAGLPGERPVAAAFGPVLLCTRADYAAVGGHAAIRSEVLEDVALARRFRAAGLPVRCLSGRGAIEFRMYPEGGRQLVEGWTKNIAAGAWSATRPWALALTICWIAALVAVALDVVAHPGVPAAILYAAVAAQLVWLLRRVGRFAWWAWMVWPVGLAVFLAVFARSLVLRLLRRPVRWKGRTIPAR